MPLGGDLTSPPDQQPVLLGRGHVCSHREPRGLVSSCPYPLAETMLLATCQPTGPWGEAGTSTPRGPAPSFTRIIPKCSGVPAGAWGELRIEAGRGSLGHTLEMAEGACPTFLKPGRVTSCFPKPWKGRVGHTTAPIHW